MTKLNIMDIREVRFGEDAWNSKDFRLANDHATADRTWMVAGWWLVWVVAGWWLGTVWSGWCWLGAG